MWWGRDEQVVEVLGRGDGQERPFGGNTWEKHSELQKYRVRDSGPR